MHVDIFFDIPPYHQVCKFYHKRRSYFRLYSACMYSLPCWCISNCHFSALMYNFKLSIFYLHRTKVNLFSAYALKLKKSWTRDCGVATITKHCDIRNSVTLKCITTFTTATCQALPLARSINISHLTHTMITW